jgi:hypothetical protein
VHTKFKDTWYKLLDTPEMQQAQLAVERAAATNKLPADVVEHMARVGFNTAVLAHSSELNLEQTLSVSVGALIHDLGKCGLVSALKSGNFTSDRLAELKHNHPITGLKKILRIPIVGQHVVMPAQGAMHHTHFKVLERNYPTKYGIKELINKGLLHERGVEEAIYSGPLLAHCDVYDAFTHCDDPTRKLYMTTEQLLNKEERMAKAINVVNRDIVPTLLTPEESAELIFENMQAANEYAARFVA